MSFLNDQLQNKYSKGNYLWVSKLVVSCCLTLTVSQFTDTKMVFSAVQLTFFFTNIPQIALSVAAHDSLEQEGIESIDNFDDFKDDQLYPVIKNMRTSIPGVDAVLGVQDIAVVPGVAPITPCIFSAKCDLRLKVISLVSVNTMQLVTTEIWPTLTTLRSSGPSILSGRRLSRSRKRQSPTCCTFPRTALPLNGLNISRIAFSTPMGFMTDIWYMWSGTLLRYQIKHMIHSS